MVGAPSGEVVIDDPALAVPVPVEEVLSVDEAVPVPLVERLPDELVPLLVALPESEPLDDAEAVPLSEDAPLAPLNVTVPVATSWLCGGAGTVPASMLDADDVLITELLATVPLLLRLPLLATVPLLLTVPALLTVPLPLVLTELVALAEPTVQLAVPVDAAW